MYYILCYISLIIYHISYIICHILHKQLADERLQKQRASLWDGIEFKRAGTEAAVLQTLLLKSKLPGLQSLAAHQKSPL